MSEEQKRILFQKLWNIANVLRGTMSADEYRDYILGFIFYKYLSEKMENFANDLLEANAIKFRDIDDKEPNNEKTIEAIKKQALNYLGYFLKPSELFYVLTKRGNSAEDNFILEELEKILKNIQNSTMGTESEDDFEDLFEDMDLKSTKLGKTPTEINAVIVQILTHIDQVDFKLNETEIDVLGDAYEYLIEQFAAGAGKKAGEFYTPQQVSKILAKIVTTGKKRLQSVYDPTCGSGSLLLRVARELENENVSNFYGQEKIRTTYNLARMNMILHGVHYSKFDIKRDDSLENPQHLDKMPFEAIVANPPFSAKWSANPLFKNDERFSQYGKLAPSSKADFAFAQHMIYHLAEDGTMAIVLPHGVLFRGGAELQIRRFLIEKQNYLDAVIGLPANIFYGTNIPTCILVFKKCRNPDDNILFIDASNDFEKVKTQNVLRDQHINKIIDTYRNRTQIEKYSHLATLEEVEQNDYNLNIPRYVNNFQEEEPIDIKSLLQEQTAIQTQSAEIDKQIEQFFKELQIAI